MDFSNINFSAIAIQFAVLLFSLSIHEASHAWMADRRGDNTARYLGRVTLNPLAHIDPIGTVLFPLLQFFTNLPLIGWAKPVPMNPAHLKNPQKDQIYISLAGPASNFLAGTVALFLLLIAKHLNSEANLSINYMAATMQIPGGQSILIPILGMLFFLVIINYALAIFNVIPIPPLDGHWILYGLLPAKAATALARFGTYGFFLLYALMFMGIFQFIFIPINIIRGLLIKW
jgi:Zn-dependent protease